MGEEQNGLSDPYPVEITLPLLHLLMLSSNLLGLLNLREDVCSVAHSKALQSPAKKAISAISSWICSWSLQGFFWNLPCSCHHSPARRGRCRRRKGCELVWQWERITFNKKLCWSQLKQHIHSSEFLSCSHFPCMTALPFLLLPINAVFCGTLLTFLIPYFKN